MKKTDPPPPTDNLELMEFPAEVDIKVFARAGDALESRIHDLLAENMQQGQVLGVRLKQSSKGNYHSLSCKVRVDDRVELDQVFAALSAHPDILMVL